MSTSFKYQQLNEDEVKEVIVTNKEIYDTLVKLLDVRDTTLKLLQSLKEDIDVNYIKSKMAKIGGALSTITGAGACLAGFALIPFTLGGSLSVAVIGGGMVATGATTVVGVERGFFAVPKEKIDAANEACKIDKEIMKKLNELGKIYQRLLTALAERHSITTTKVLEIANKSYKLVDVADATKTSNTAVPTLLSILRVVSVGAVVLDAVFIPKDIAVLTKESAQEMQKMIKRLEEHQYKLIAEKDKYF